MMRYFLLVFIFFLVKVHLLWTEDYGPDGLGYIATDNVSPLAPDYPPHNPDEINDGEPVNGLGDDDCVNVTLPFTFVFYGISYYIVQVCSNGFLKFSEGPYTTDFVGLDQQTGEILSEPIPSPKYPAGIFFWFLDLDPTKISSSSKGVVTKLLDEDTDRERFVIQYNNIPYVNGFFPVTIQIQLYKNTNQIVIHYLSVQGSPVNPVIGIQDAGGDNGLLYEFPTSSIRGGHTISFILPPFDQPSGYFVNDSINTAQLGKSGRKVLLQTFQPAFSAIFQSSEEEDIAKSFKLEISTTANFQRGTVISVFGDMADVKAFTRTPDIVYGGATLQVGIEYFYRLTFWNQNFLRSRTQATSSSSFCIQSCSRSNLNAPFIGEGESLAGCFIATKTLSNKNKLSPFYMVRNNYLIKSGLGKNIITTYYKNATKLYSTLGKSLSIFTYPVYSYLNFALSTSFLLKMILLSLYIMLFIIITFYTRWQ